ncbi:hypothetical protein [Petrachloros mirabilis]
MGERIVDNAVAVVVPRVIKEDQVPRSYSGPLMKLPVLPDMVVDEPYTVCLPIIPPTVIEVDAVREKNRPGHTSAVVGNPSAIDFNGGGSNKLGGCPNNIVSGWVAPG